MKVSVVITILNEEKTVGRLLDSLANQTRRPDEIIIIDGGSSDRTVAKIKEYQILNTKYKILIRPEASIAAGRNFGVRKAQYPIIAMTDAGCVAHKDWLEKLTGPFTFGPGLSCLKGQALSLPGIAAGFYRMTGESVFQRCLRCYLGVLPEKLNPKNFLPSTRSIAFRKAIWEKIGGFNETLERTGEDTFFNYQAKKLGAKFVTVPEALVDWEMPNTWSQAIKKFYWYARGDAQTSIWWDSEKRFSTHNIKIAAIFARYLFGLLFLFMALYSLITYHLSHITYFWLLVISSLFLIYASWSIAKNYRYIRRWQAIIILPILQITSDLAVMAGFLSGLLLK